jgi:pullulanase/glycogen debranching enzyme
MVRVWHGFGPGVGAGQVYGFRVNGPFGTQRGSRRYALVSAAEQALIR